MELQSGAGRRAARSLDNGILLRRWFGCWIDFIVAAIVFFLPAVTLGGLGRALGVDPILVLLFSVVCVFAYFIVAEGVTGRTVGKLVSGTIVVDAEGRPPGLWRATIRTLMRLIEVNPFLIGGIPAGIAVAMTQHNQRLGDKLAGTYVVVSKRLAEKPPAHAVAAVFD